MANIYLNIDKLKPKRKRSANWDTSERILLRKCMKGLIPIIENKNTDTNTNKSKINAWQTVTRRFNSSNMRERELADVKQQWRNMKYGAKKNLFKSRLTVKCRESEHSSSDPGTLEICSITPQEIESDSSVIDSDSIANQEESLVSVSTQDNVLNPVVKQENISPPPLKKLILQDVFEPRGTKRNLPDDDVINNEHTNLQEKQLNGKNNDVLVTCMKEEHILKMKHMSEAQRFLEEEHNMKMQQMFLQKEETLLRIEKLKLEISLLQSNLS